MTSINSIAPAIRFDRRPVPARVCRVAMPVPGPPSHLVLPDRPTPPGEGAGTRIARDDVARGIRSMVLAVFLFSMMAALVKWYAVRYPVGQIVFLRNACALPSAFAIVLQQGGIGLLRTRRLGAHALRSLVGGTAMATGFFSLSRLPLPDATAIGFTAPLFTTILAIPLLGEKVRLHRWSAVLVGFLGVAILARSQGAFGAGAAQALGIAAGLANGLFSALSSLLVRQISRTENSAAIAFYQAAIQTAITSLVLPFGWINPPWPDLVGLVSIGLLGGLGQFWFTQAFRYAPASVASPFLYTAIVWATGFGWAFWGDLPNLGTVLGIAVIVASGLYILHRELYWARRRSAEAARAEEKG